MDDESVLMRPSQFLLPIREHKPVRVVTPKRHLLKQNNTISETGLQIVKRTCRDSSTKGALLSVVDPAAWVMLSPPRKKTAPDYERWRNRLDFQSSYEPDLSATSHLVSRECRRTGAPCRVGARTSVQALLLLYLGILNYTFL